MLELIVNAGSVASGRSIGEPRRLVEVTLAVGAMIRIHGEITPASISRLVAAIRDNDQLEGH